MARPRVLISTDIGGSDKDDAQSMVHAMLQADKLDYRGFVVTRSDDGGKLSGRPSSGEAMIREVIDAYAKDLPNLRSHSKAFPSAESLKAKIASGARDSGFPGKLSEGAQLIIDEARDASPKDPLWILTWGPIHDAAAALLRAPDIVDSVRLYSIAGLAQDKAHPQAFNALRKAVATDSDYKDLFWIDNSSSFRGMMVDAGGSKAKGIQQSYSWVKEHTDGHGALGELFFEKYSHAITHKSGIVGANGLKMGDTPSLLYLIDQAADGNPAAKSWGGRFVKDGHGNNTWDDLPGAATRMGKEDGARTVYEHREAIRADFAKRLDWADGKAGPVKRSAAAEPAAEREADGDGWIAPGSKGKVKLNGDRLDAGEVSRIAGLDFEDGDTLIFRQFDEGTLRAVSGGNPLQVNKTGTFARVDSLEDIRELVDARGDGVTASVDLDADTLTLGIEHDGGTHFVLLAGLGEAYDSLM